MESHGVNKCSHLCMCSVLRTTVRSLMESYSVNKCPHLFTCSVLRISTASPHTASESHKEEII